MDEFRTMLSAVHTALQSGVRSDLKTRQLFPADNRHGSCRLDLALPTTDH